MIISECKRNHAKEISIGNSNIKNCVGTNHMESENVSVTPACDAKLAALIAEPCTKAGRVASAMHKNLPP